MDKNPETIPTAEPFMIKGGPVGCLLLHGYTGAPKEMRMLAESLSGDGYTVLAPRLFGHATDPQDMLRARWWDWIASAEDGLNILRSVTDRQVVMGLSMGGVLSLILAARYKVNAVVSYSSPCKMPDDPRLKLIRLLHWFVPRQPKGLPDWHNLEAAKDHVDYPYFPTRSIIELQELIKVMRSELPAVKVPAFFVQSHGDHTISPESMDFLYKHVSSKVKNRLWVDDSGHVVIREPESEKIFSETKLFLSRVLGTQ